SGRGGNGAAGAGAAADREAGQGDDGMSPIALGVVVFLPIFLFSRWIRILNEYERAVTFWLGRLAPAPKGPGLVLIFWPFERMVKVSFGPVVATLPVTDGI